MNKMEEKILVFDRKHLFNKEELTFQGLLTDEVAVKQITSRFNHFFEARRGDAETRKQWKQPIPYVILKRGEEVFLYERLTAGVEDRLHGQLSIGVGGHMNVLDESYRWKPNFLKNMYKELHEELHIHIPGSDTIGDPKIIGLINDDSIDVSSMHICILIVLELPEDAEVSVKETDKLEGYWVRTRDVKKPPLYAELESWSRYAAEIL